VGVEWLKDKEALHDLKLTWKDDTVGGTISSVFKKYPGYAFRVEAAKSTCHNWPLHPLHRPAN